MHLFISWMSGIFKLWEIAFYHVESLETNARYISSSQRQSKSSRSSDILPRRNQKPSVQLRRPTLLQDCEDPILEQHEPREPLSTARHIVICLRTVSSPQSTQNISVCSVMLNFYSMTTHFNGI